MEQNLRDAILAACIEALEALGADVSKLSALTANWQATGADDKQKQAA